MDFILPAVKDPDEQLTFFASSPTRSLPFRVSLSLFPLCSCSHPNALTQDQALWYNEPMWSLSSQEKLPGFQA